MTDLVLSPVPSVQMPLGFTEYPNGRTGRKTLRTPTMEGQREKARVCQEVMLILWAGYEQGRFKTCTARSVSCLPLKCLLKLLICIYQYYCVSIRPEIKLGAIQASNSAILMQGEIAPGLNR